MKKTIGILTQPLHSNYGGLLQAYALKKTLEDLGNDVVVVNRRNNPNSVRNRFKEFVKRIIKKRQNFALTDAQRDIITKHTNYFIEHYIKEITPPIYSTRELRKITSDYDWLFVGSDQVWRPLYSPNIYNYFLDFLDDSSKKGIAYAASFGVD